MPKGVNLHGDTWDPLRKKITSDKVPVKRWITDV